MLKLKRLFLLAVAFILVLAAMGSAFAAPEPYKIPVNETSVDGEGGKLDWGEIHGAEVVECETTEGGQVEDPYGSGERRNHLTFDIILHEDTDPEQEIYIKYHYSDDPQSGEDLPLTINEDSWQGNIYLNEANLEELV